MQTGISIDDFIKSSIIAYKKGFNDAIQCLLSAEKTIDEATMEKSLRDTLIKDGKIKTDW